MSESTNNLDTQEVLEESPMSRAQKAAAEDAKHRKTTKIYLAATVLLLVASIFAVVWNSGIIQKNSTAAVVGGESYSVAEVSYYYGTALQEEAYYAYYGMSAYDSTVSAKDQIYSDTTTYYDYFLDYALSQIQSLHALLAAADADGFVMDQDELDSQLASYETDLLTQAIYYGLTSVDSYIQGYVSEYLDEDSYMDIIADQLIASAYVTYKTETLDISDEMLNDYYLTNQDTLDTYELSYMVLLASEPTADEGETLTDEEIAAGLEENRVAAEADAYAIMEALEAGEDFTTLGEDYGVYGAYEDDIYVGSSLNSSFSEWLMSEDRQEGDLTVATYESTDRYVYYVVRYQDRYQDNDPTANIRHIFISAGSAPTDEEYDEAYTSAADLLAQWEAGEATAESFGDLATLYSADTSSSYLGGALTNVGTYSGYVDTFTDWCLDSSRVAGETGLVINTGSSTKGWHIMYFESWEPALWEVTAWNALVTEELTIWHDGLLATTDAQLSDGIKYLG